MTKTDDSRIIEEIRLAGGEARIAHLTKAEREIWEQQALVLSYLRPHGNVIRAARESGLPPTIEDEWYNEDMLGWKNRRKQAISEGGWEVDEHVRRGILTGEITSPTIIIGYLKSTIPERWDPGHAEREKGKSVSEALREMAAEHKRTLAQIEEKLASPAPGDSEIEDDAADKVDKELLKRLKIV